MSAKHDNRWICVPCDKFFNGIQPYKDHLNSERHKEKIKRSQNLMVEPIRHALSNTTLKNLEECIVPFDSGFKCIPCDMFLNSPQQAEQHKNGEKHKKKLTGFKQGSSEKPHNPIIASPCGKGGIVGDQCKSNFDLERYVNEENQNDKSWSETKLNTFPTISLGGLDEYLISFNSGFKCVGCDKFLNSFQQAQQHISGEKHKKMKNDKNSSKIYDSTSCSDNFPKFDERSASINDFNLNDIEVDKLLDKIKVFKAHEPISFEKSSLQYSNFLKT